MNRTLATLREFVNPSWGNHRAVPPMEGGLRPNSRLDLAVRLLPHGRYQPDDMASVGEEIWFSTGSEIHSLATNSAKLLVSCDAVVTALLPYGSSAVIAAVDGVGLVRVDESGVTSDVCTDKLVQTCVTALAMLGDGRLIATIGSRAGGYDDWALALVKQDRSGQLVIVDGPKAVLAAEGLAWPSGVATANGDGVLVSLSHDHRIEWRSLSNLGAPGRTLVANLPVYPGRIAEVADDYWVSAPYVRNRMTELLLDEPELLSDMVESVPRGDWFVPLLRVANPYTQTPQMGNVRVLNIVKPWAPARSYGVAFRMDRDGRIVESAQSRVDGERHGVTSVVVDHHQVVLAAASGYGNILKLGSTELGEDS